MNNKGTTLTNETIRQIFEEMKFNNKEPVKFICGYDFISSLDDKIFKKIFEYGIATVYCTNEEIELINERYEKIKNTK